MALIVTTCRKFAALYRKFIVWPKCQCMCATKARSMRDWRWLRAVHPLYELHVFFKEQPALAPCEIWGMLRQRWGARRQRWLVQQVVDVRHSFSTHRILVLLYLSHIPVLIRHPDQLKWKSTPDVFSVYARFYFYTKWYSSPALRTLPYAAGNLNSPHA